MNQRRRALFRFAAGQLAAIVGMLHLWLGIRQWSLYLRGGIFVPPDIRVPLWTISGVAILVCVTIVALEEIDAPIVYAAGIAMSLVYILGYYSWHLGGHRSFFLVGDPGLIHEGGWIQFLLAHTFDVPLVERFALATEAGLLITLLVLLRESMNADE